MRRALVLLVAASACAPFDEVDAVSSHLDYFVWIRVSDAETRGTPLMTRAALQMGVAGEGEELFLVGYSAGDLEWVLPADRQALASASVGRARDCDPELPAPSFVGRAHEGQLLPTTLGFALTAEWLDLRCPVREPSEVAVELLCEQSYSARLTRTAPSGCRFEIEFILDNRSSLEVRVDPLGRTCTRGGDASSGWDGGFSIEGCAGQSHLVPNGSVPVELERYPADEILLGRSVPSVGFAVGTMKFPFLGDFGLARDFVRAGDRVVLAARREDECEREPHTYLLIRDDDGRVSTATTSPCVFRLAPDLTSGDHFLALALTSSKGIDLLRIGVDGVVEDRRSIPGLGNSDVSRTSLTSHGGLVTALVSSKPPNSTGALQRTCIASFEADNLVPIRAAVCSGRTGAFFVDPRSYEGGRLEVAGTKTKSVFLLDPERVEATVAEPFSAGDPGVTNAELRRPLWPGFDPSIGGFVRAPTTNERVVFGYERASEGGVIYTLTDTLALGYRAASFMMGPWLPTSVVAWGRDILLTATMSEDGSEGASFLVRYDPTSGRFRPERTRLGEGSVIRVREDLDDSLLVLLAETGELIRIRAR